MSLDPKFYQGREQTYIKHFVLENYLRKLAYKKGWYGGVLNYVDCFAGPWQHASENAEDTSPFIAIRELRAVRNDLLARGRSRLRIRCLFIEKNREACSLLDEKLRSVRDVEVQTLHGDFESNVEAVLRFAAAGGRSFTFFFIDPTGWTGFSLEVRNDAGRPADREQEKTLWKAARGRTGQEEMFGAEQVGTYAARRRRRYQVHAFDLVQALLRGKGRVAFDELEARALLCPFMSTQALKNWLVAEQKAGHLHFEGLKPKQRVPQPDEDHWVVLNP